MNTLIHADIFFLVTTVAVVLIASLFIVVIIYVVRILNDFRYISGIVRKEADLLAEDIDELRAEVKSKGLFGGISAIISEVFSGLGKRSKGKKQRISKKPNHK